MTRLVLADNEGVVRGALRCLLERETDLRVVGESGDGHETVKIVTRLKPDVLITDVALPGLHGLEVTRRVRARVPVTGVVILSHDPDERYLAEALRRGALGYVGTRASVTDLLRAVRAVARGRRYLGPPLSAESIDAWVARATGTPDDPHDRLTIREREILRLVAEGFTSPGIARRLGISARTADTHRANLMRKLRLRHRAALIRYALSRGLIAPVPTAGRPAAGGPHRRARRPRPARRRSPRAGRRGEDR